MRWALGRWLCKRSGVIGSPDPPIAVESVTTKNREKVCRGIDFFLTSAPGVSPATAFLSRETCMIEEDVDAVSSWRGPLSNHSKESPR